MNISKRDIHLLIGFSGILVAALVYFFVYTPMLEKTEQLEAENTQLSTHIAELEALAAKQDFFLTETERMDQEIRDIYDEFPADVRVEDALLQGITMQQVSLMNMNKINYEAAGELYRPIAQSADQVPATVSSPSVPEDGTTAPEDGASVPAEGAVAAESNIIAMRQPVTYEYSCSYDEFKRSVDYLCSSSNRQTISQVALVYDSSTGELSGQTDISMYYITGTGKAYIEPNLPAVALGTNNLFSTIVVSNQSQQPETGETSEQ